MKPNKKDENPWFCIKLSALIVIIFSILVYSDVLLASPISKTQAQKLVRGWLKADQHPLGAVLGRQIGEIDTFADSDGQSMYYVVYLQPSGFVIVSGDDMVEPIICFAEIGEYEPSEDNPLGALVSRDLPLRIAAARKLQVNPMSITDTNERITLQETAADAKSKWNELSAFDDRPRTLGISTLSDVRIEPLVQSKWGQSTIGNIIGYPACYNYYTPPYETPDGDPNNYPCGCVATAMSQLMRYHEHPENYDWANMPFEPDLSTTELERQTIGGLCYDVAEAIDTIYGPNGSSAYVSDADVELVAAFGYSNSIYGYYPSTGSVLNAMINPNLDAGKAVILGLSGPGTGHAVICDGYGYNSTTLYHHLNMGWNGSDDAWYNLPIVDAYYYYNVVDECMYNVFISGTGEIISGRVTDMAGNPIPAVTVSAQAAGTGTYQTTTNDKGIYALVNLPSNKTYSVTATKPPYVFENQNASIGQSTDYSSTSGNKWGVDFVSQSEGPPIAYNQNIETVSGEIETITLQASDDGLPNPPGQLAYIIDTLPEHGTLTDPAADEIVNVPYTLTGNIVEYRACSYFVGQDLFNFKANDGGTPPQGGDSEPAIVTIDVNNIIYTTFEPQTNVYASWPMGTYYHDSRTQVIYLASEIGDARAITDLALDVYQVPGQPLDYWTIRMKHTGRSYYSGSPYFETTDWTIVYQNNESISSTGWQNFHFQNAFEYNGTDNLLIDFSHNNTYYTTDGYCMVSDTGSDRVVMAYSDSDHGDPLDWSDYTPGLSLYGSEAVPNIKLIGTVPADPISGDFEPDCDVDFYDFAILAQSWLSSMGQDNYNPICDMSPNGVIDWPDLKILAENWLETDQ